jgi:adenylate cyclase class 2
MSIEYEVKYININEKYVKNKLLELGATKVHDKIMLHRTVFYMCDTLTQGYVRVRNNGDNVTITTKTYQNQKFPEETEITINESYEYGCKFIKSLGLIQKSVHESYREKWNHPLAHEITFDTIPGLPTYMEIDCTSEKNLNDMINLLGLDKKNIRYGSYDKTYEEYYGIKSDVINKIPSLTFANILNEITPTINKELLIKLANMYNKDTKSSKKQVKNKVKKQSKKTSKKQVKKKQVKTK